MRVLIIEDHPTTVAYLYKGLHEHQFIPEIASDGAQGLYLAQNQSYSAIILDIMLPKMDGWEVLKKLRASRSQTPILCLTARDSIEDRVKGLELGADDYLVKPFAFSELNARLNTILRRKSPSPSQVTTIADLIIDPSKHRVIRGQRLLTLTSKEFMLLHLFSTHLGRVLTRTFIAEQVWDIHFDCNTNTIDVAVKRLRDKVDQQDDEVKLIHTIRGVGYVMDIR